MSYTNKQKADFYFKKFNELTFNPALSSIYWDLYKHYKAIDQALLKLSEFRSKYKPSDPSKWKVKSGTSVSIPKPKRYFLGKF